MPLSDLDLAHLCLTTYGPAAETLPGYFCDPSEEVEGLELNLFGDTVFAFRGSDEIGDWLGRGNLNVSAAQWPQVGCWCHGGAKAAWDSVRPVIADKIAAAHARGDRVWYAGHSRGKVIAENAAQEFGGHAFVGFGGPRNGNDEFNRHLHRSVPNIRLYANGKDLVTRHPWFVWEGLTAHRVEHPVPLTDIGSWWTRWTPPWGTIMGRHSMDWYVKKLERQS